MPYNFNYYNRPRKKVNRNDRADHQKGHRMEFERNRKKVIAANSVCAICGKRVNKRLKYPHPMSATVDHIIPLSKGRHPSDLENLQLAHFICNRRKSDKLPEGMPEKAEIEEVVNNDLPLSMDWTAYNEKNQIQLRAEVEKIESTGRHLYSDGVR